MFTQLILSDRKISKEHSRLKGWYTDVQKPPVTPLEVDMAAAQEDYMALYASQDVLEEMFDVKVEPFAISDRPPLE